MNQPPTAAEIRLAQYGQRTKTWSTATYNDGTEKALHEIALGLKAEVDRLRDQLAALHTKTLVLEADALVKHCPDHGPQDQDGVWMDCHCAVADDMRRRAAVVPAVPTTTKDGAQ